MHNVRWDGEDIDISQAAIKLGLSYSRASYFIVRLGLTNKEELVKKVADVSAGRRTSQTSGRFQFITGKMTVFEFWESHPFKSEVSTQMLRNRATTHGYDSPVMLYPRCTQQEFKELLKEDGLYVEPDVVVHEKMPIIKVTLDRTKCLKGWYLCKHYNSCTDSVCFEQKFHERYKPDHSCYVKSVAHHINKKHGDCVPNHVSRMHGGFSE